MSERIVSLEFFDRTSTVRTNVAIRQLVIAGWAGRDADATEKHIAELEALGVRRPLSTPIFYRVAASRLTTDGEIETLGAKSSGEVECLMLQANQRLWIGVGSDHTDREVETYGVSVSKQMCDKPVAPIFWPYAEVAGHWDQLVLRSVVTENGRAVIYQEGTVAALLPPPELIARFAESGALAEGTMMYCGTLPVIGGIRPAPRFEFELEDPVENRKIRHAYTVKTLPIAG